MKITFGATEVELPTGTFVLTYGIGMSKATSTLDLRVDISVQDFYTIPVAGYHDGNFTDKTVRKPHDSLVLVIYQSANSTIVTLMNHDGVAPTPMPSTSVLLTPLPKPTPIPIATPISGKVSGSDTYRIVGTFELFETEGAEFKLFGEFGCVGLDGYFDIGTGKQVIIRNQSGGIIAATKFEADATASTS